MITEKIKNELMKHGETLFNAPMKNYTTFKTGGPADALIIPDGKGALSKILKISKINNIPLTVIGGGSNLLVGDKGIRGIVIRLFNAQADINGIYIQEDGSIYSCASVSKKAFIDFAVNNGYSGVEFMAGVPGCMGGGIYMNAGTFLGSFSEILTKITVFKLTGKEKTIKFTKDMAKYRKLDFGFDGIIAGAYFNLPKADSTDEVKNKIKSILDDRAKKHPLQYPSAGSVFKNPEGHFSWKLIDEAGLKGKSVGGASISELHTNFIINTGNATSMDVKNLINLVQEKVMQKFNIMLEPEVKMLGDF